MLLTASRDRTAKLFDLQCDNGDAPETVESLEWHTASVLGAAAVGSLVLTASADGLVKVRLGAIASDRVIYRIKLDWSLVIEKQLLLQRGGRRGLVAQCASGTCPADCSGQTPTNLRSATFSGTSCHRA